MTGTLRTRVVVAAGGLGTRVGCWSRYLPKEFLPVAGRPGIVHILEEIAQLGPAHVVIVHHPYYSSFATWARQALSPHSRTRYVQAAGQDLFEPDRHKHLLVEFVVQRGPYADLTSIFNADDRFATTTTGAGELYVVFSDNLYPGAHPLLDLAEASPGVSVLARPFCDDLAAQRGVIATRPDRGHRRMVSLTEKPDSVTAYALQREHGRGNLFLNEGRARLSADFIAFARARVWPSQVEPKLALAIGAYAHDHPVRVIRTSSDVIDLGTPGLVTSMAGSGAVQVGK
ncbi:sugar phosphate nucleotidyltransferase [Nonomuraea sp. NPDC049129]|uniref:sugar phosphate nucleotidyltransferase n=1 Tax=Nonomuraea sp. NPDC049129 TaxID=3155272 RepID=UPI0033ECC163